MIISNNKNVVSVYLNGKTIQAVYFKENLVWPDETILACFNGLGGWNDDYPWSDDIEWNDN